MVQLDYPGNGFKSTSILAQDRISADGPALGGDGRDSLEVRDEEGRVGKGGIISCQPISCVVKT